MRTTTCKSESLVVSLHHPRHAEAEACLCIGHQIFKELHQHLGKQDKQDIDIGRIQANKRLEKLLDCRFPVTLNNHFLTDVWRCPSISYVKICFIIQLIAKHLEMDGHQVPGLHFAVIYSATNFKPDNVYLGISLVTGFILYGDAPPVSNIGKYRLIRVP